MKTECPFLGIPCHALPAVGKGLPARAQESEKKPRVKTVQVKAHMKTADHDRQGQAAPRRYRQITHSSLVHFR